MAQGSEEKVVKDDVQQQKQAPANFEETVQMLQSEADRAQSSNAMLEGACRGDYAKVIRALANGADKTASDNDGNTAMHLSVAAGCRDVVELLLGLKFPADLSNKAGFTPLSSAASAGHTAIAEDLLLAGVNANHETPGILETPLMIATYRDFPALVSCLLKHGAKVDQQDANGATAAMRAAGQNNAECLSLLLTAGADRAVTSKSGRTVRDFALRTKATEALDVLTAAAPETSPDNR
ncbi:MAG: ankyrin repeat domain-containing protein [Alphaproteobacteria bacterium]